MAPKMFALQVWEQMGASLSSKCSEGPPYCCSMANCAVERRYTRYLMPEATAVVARELLSQGGVVKTPPVSSKGFLESFETNKKVF